MWFVFVFNLCLLFPQHKPFDFSFHSYFIISSRFCQVLQNIGITSVYGRSCSSPSNGFISCVFCNFFLVNSCCFLHVNQTLPGAQFCIYFCLDFRDSLVVEKLLYLLDLSLLHSLGIVTSDGVSVIGFQFHERLCLLLRFPAICKPSFPLP